MRGSKRSAAASCQQQCAGSALEAAANKKHKIQGSLGIVTPFAIVKVREQRGHGALGHFGAG